MSHNIDRLIAATRPTDDEIAAEFTPDRQQAILDRVLGAGNVTPLTAPHRASRRRWLAVAAAGVAVLAVGALAVSTQRLEPTIVGPTPSASVPGTTAPASPTVSSSSTAEAPVIALAAVAQAAGARAPVVVGAGQYLHVVWTETQTGESPSSTTHDTYVASDGWTWRLDTGSQNFWMLTKPSSDGVHGLETLPTDPVALDAKLRSAGGSQSGDERVWKGVNEILNTNAASPQLRRAAILVLQNLAQHPQSPAEGKGGLATPHVVVTRVTLASGESGYRAVFTDKTSRPGVSWTMVLDEDGDLVETGSKAEGMTFTGTYTVREVVNALPADFIAALGTDRVEHLP